MTVASSQSAKATLEKVGRALHGDQFVNPLAGDLQVSHRTMRSWLAGTREVPGGVWDDLAELMENQQRRLKAALWQLNHDQRLATVERDRTF